MVKDNSASSVILDIIIYVVLILLMIVTLYPIIYILSVSLSSQAAYEAGEVMLWPIGINLEAYRQVVTDGTVPMSFLQAVINTLLYTVISLFMTTTLAYPLSRSKDRVPFHGLITKLIIFTMFFSAGMIPTYLIVQKVGLLNTRWALIIPVAITTYNLVVMRSFFESVPVELEEAAFIDGANHFQVFFKVMLPMALPGIAALFIMQFIGCWNNYESTILYMKEYPNLSYALYAYDEVKKYDANVPVYFAGVLVALIPVLALFFAFQNTIMERVYLGGLKG